MQPTQRTYTNKANGEVFRFYVNPDNSNHMILFSEKTGEKMPNYLIAAFTPIDFKLRDKTIVKLLSGEIFPIDPANPPIQKKFFMQTRFSKY